MKRLSAVIIMALFFGSALFAQESAAKTYKNEASAYVKVLYIDRIAPHSLGYKVWYRSQDGHRQITYLPIKWFYGPNGKGQLVQTWDKSGPYMEVFFKDNAFWYVRLHVMPTFNDPTWGVIFSNEQIDNEFNVDEPKITL